MIYKNKNFLIAGISKSGVSSANALLLRDAKVFLYDDKPNENISILFKKGAVDVSGKPVNEVLKNIYCIIKSPGIPLENNLLKYAVNFNIPIISEIELGWYLYKGTSLAVTGTNGKSTVTSLIDYILKTNGEKSFLCGNIGIPFTDFCDSPTDSFCCIEISSFQLENCFEFKPHICAVLNITEDHMNRHFTMDNYIMIKKRILKNQRKTEYAVLNFDCKNTRALFEDAKSNVIWFSGKQKVNGAYIEDEYLKYNGEKIIHTGEIKLIGHHNLLNCLAAICFAKLLNIDNEIIKKALSTFEGIPHRLQNIGSVNGRTFYNDSKATNVDSTLVAIRSVKAGTILILGGYDKHLGFKELFKEIKTNKNIEHCIFCGQVRQKLYDDATAVGYTKFSMSIKFDKSVYKAYELCKEGGAVLLSPACASFDEFKNFEERGEKFCSIVRNLQNEKQS